VRTEGFKGVLLLTLTIASLMVPAKLAFTVPDKAGHENSCVAYTIEPGVEIKTEIYPAADVYAFGGNGTGYSRSQLKFDIHSIPSRSNILSAKLWLYRFAADNWDGGILLSRVDDQLWGENITTTEFDAQTLTNEETRLGKFMSSGWDYLEVVNQLNVDHEAGRAYSSYRLRWANDNGSGPSVGIDDGRFLHIESRGDELSIIFSSSEYNGSDPYLEVVYIIFHGWDLIDTWTSTIEASAEWQIMESWTGTVPAPIRWNLIETWTKTVSAPVKWQTVEIWTGAVKTPPAPAEWRTVEIWKGTVNTLPAPPAPAKWELIKIWTGAISTPVVAPPSKPSLISPPDDTITDDNTPTFDWSDVTGAENYDLLIDDNPDFSSPEVQVTVPVSTYTSTVKLPDDNYSWKVRARDAAGNISGWSSVWTLLIKTIVRRVEVSISPENRSGPPGETLNYAVTVKNTGSTDDTYTLSAVGAEGWSVSIEPTSLILAAGTSGDATLSVRIPTGAIENDSMTVTVTAKSMADPSVTGSDTCVTVVKGAPVVPGVDLALLAILAFPIGAAILLPAYLHRRRRRAARLGVLRAVALSLGAALLAMIYHLRGRHRTRRRVLSRHSKISG